MDIVDCSIGSKLKRRTAKPKVTSIKLNRVYYCKAADTIYLVSKAATIYPCCDFIGFL